MAPRRRARSISDDESSDDESNAYHSSDFESANYISSPSTSSDSDSANQSSSDAPSSTSETRTELRHLIDFMRHTSIFIALQRQQQNTLIQQLATFYTDEGSTLTRTQQLAHIQNLLSNIPRTETQRILSECCSTCARNSNAKLRRYDCSRCQQQFLRCHSHRIHAGSASPFCNGCSGSVTQPHLQHLNMKCALCSAPGTRENSSTCTSCSASYTFCARHYSSVPHILRSRCLTCASRHQVTQRRNQRFVACANCTWQIETSESSVSCTVCSAPIHVSCDSGKKRMCTHCTMQCHQSSCVSCHGLIQLADIAFCLDCSAPIHARTCIYERRCAACHRASRCSVCNHSIDRGHSAACITCATKCHLSCTTGGKCQSCYNEFSAAVPDVHNLGSVSLCRHCPAQQFNSSRSFCCSKGKHQLSSDVILEPPALYQFFERHQQLLIDRGREINQLASFFSVGVSTPGNAYGGVQLPHNETCFAQIEGKLFHFKLFDSAPRSHPLLGNATSFLFHDVSSVESFSERFSQQVVSAALELRDIMTQRNRHVHQIRETFGMFQSQQDFMAFFRATPELRIRIADNMEHSATARSQLTMLFSTEGSIFSRPDTLGRILRGQQGQNDLSVPYYNQHYESMCYPLFDISGCHGWFHNKHERSQFCDSAGNPLSLREYIQYNFSQNQIHRLVPRLQQEWLLDQISRAESVNRSYTLQMMENARARRTATLRQLRRELDPATAGRHSTIPSSVRGSFAYRRQKVNMGMAHVHRFGPPTLFITFTANPQWKEIKETLRPGQKWFHDVYLVNLVFREKLDSLISNIKTGKYFEGRTSVWTQYAIEFQKRGLPHAHILVKLSGDQPILASEVDKLSTVMFPSLCSSQCRSCRQCILHQRVKTHMIHQCYAGRCDKQRFGQRKLSPQERRLFRQSSANPSDKGYDCYYNFPFPPNPISCLGTDGKWLLRRSQHESLIVEYNPQLLLEYDAHINVQVTTGSKCILYLRKYLTKGPDVADVGLSHATAESELEHFYQCRCMTASEAGWIACGFPFQHFDPPVKLLSLHLPGEEPVSYDDRDDIDNILQSYSKINYLELYYRRPPSFENTLFEDYFSKCDVSAEGRVKVRGQPIVTTVSTVDFSNEEHFALYMLLKTLKPRSYSDLFQSGDTVFESLSEHAKAIGVIGQTSLAMYQTVFSIMAQRHEPSDRFIDQLLLLAQQDGRIFENIFNEYWQHICQRRNVSRHSALLIIREALMKEGLSLSDVLQQSSDPFLREIAGLPDLSDQEVQSFFVHSINQLPLSQEQSACHDAILGSVDQRLFYINGCAGSGKTYLLRQIIRSFSDRFRNVLSCAYTGAAASLLPMAFTCHKLFRIPVKENEQGSDAATSPTFADLNANSRCVNARLIRSASVIVIDEISMVSREMFILIESVLREVCNSSEPWAGKTIIIAGDFNQQAPILTSVSRHSMCTKVVAASIKGSPQFSAFQTLHLTHAHRFQNPLWAQFLLNNIAKGKSDANPFNSVPDSAPGTFTADIPEHFPLTFISPAQLKTFCSDDFLQPYALQYLGLTHQDVNRFNEQQTSAYFEDDEIRSYFATYTFPKELSRDLTHDIVSQIQENNAPPHELRLAVGMPVMILRNLLISKGVSNGALGIIEALDDYTVDVRIDETNQIVSLSRICFPTNHVGNRNFIRHQFPIVPAFAITIPKSQGKTTRKQQIINLSIPCFAHGQLYVALSRATDEKNIVVVSDSGRNNIHNVVYQQLSV